MTTITCHNVNDQAYNPDVRLLGYGGWEYLTPFWKL